jgi:hypothetical protein
MFVCPNNGHLTDPHFADGPVCPKHGVPFFTHCPDCETEWPLVAGGAYSAARNWGADFCGQCASPAPWLSRPRLLAWVRDQLQASAARGDVPRPATLELIEALKRLDAMGADDTRTVEVWKRVREMAPKVWDATKPVRDALIGETVKRLLGL